jgi:Copper transport outer membrane protein, MctB
VIDFRYHIVSLIAVFLALTVGIVLGSGPLDEPIQGQLKAQADSLKRDSDKLRAQIAAQDSQLQANDAFTAEVTRALVPNQLAARTVVVVALPGVDKGQITPVTQILTQAGATVTGSVRLSAKYVDPKNTSALEDLALRLVPPGVTFADKATPMQRVATVLAASLVVDDASKAGQVDNDAAEVIAGMSDFGAIDTTGEPSRRAELVVVLAPPAPDPPTTDTDAANAAMATLPEVLDQRSRGAVVSGARLSAAKGGFVAVIRSAGNNRKGLSTVDDVDTSPGRLATVLALVEQVRKGSGDYGSASGVDGAIPDLSAPAR